MKIKPRVVLPYTVILYKRYYNWINLRVITSLSKMCVSEYMAKVDLVFHIDITEDVMNHGIDMRIS